MVANKVGGDILMFAELAEHELYPCDGHVYLQLEVVEEGIEHDSAHRDAYLDGEGAMWNLFEMDDPSGFGGAAAFDLLPWQ